MLLIMFTPIGCHLYQTCEDRKSGPVVCISGGGHRNSLNIATGHLSPPVANIFGRKLLGSADSPDWRVFVRFSMNSTYSVLSSSTPKEKSSTVILWCSCRPRRPKYWVRSHQTVWTRTCGLPFPSFFISHSSFSSVVDRLLALFGRLPLPCCCSS